MSFANEGVDQSAADAWLGASGANLFQCKCFCGHPEMVLLLECGHQLSQYLTIILTRV